MYHGIINVYKEAGFTSNDVVCVLRGILGQKKIGHTGTLDPDAIGVLPVCLGTGTKLCELLTDKQKEYLAVMRLGVRTDTQDMSGTVLESKEVNVTEEQIREVCQSFVGSYGQIPPMYSAISINGKRLYELAREGKTVERKPRLVEIYRIEIEKMELPFVTIRVNCGKGTYIRTLCEDIGEKLGCLAAMEHLTRTRVDAFCLEDALTLEQIKKSREDQTLAEHIVAVDQIFPSATELVVSKPFRMIVENGNKLFPNMLVQVPEQRSKLYRVYRDDHTFMGLYKEEAGVYKPYKMFLGGDR